MEEEEHLKQITFIEDRIFLIRDQQVMIDRDLAELYSVETKILNQAVKRNIDKFPEEFRFQLANDERIKLVTNCDRFEKLKHSSVNPYAFTEHGILMLANVLNSKTATQMSIRLVKAFVQIRQILISNTQISFEIERIKNILSQQNNKQDRQDGNIELLFQYIDRLQEKLESPTPTERKQIGYKIGGEDKGD